MSDILASWLVEGIGIAVVATLVVRMVPAASASQRHLFWWCALAGVLALPWVDGLLSLAPAGVLPTASMLPSAGGSTPFSIPAPSSRVVMVATTIWGLISLVSLVRLGLSLRAVRRLVHEAHPLSPEVESRLHQFLDARASSRAVRVSVSDELRGACAVGFLTPTILVSSRLAATLDEQALEAIILHEYAHLQRFDDWTQLLQRAVLAVAGLHPAVRWISRYIDLEREAACDRLVVERTAAPLAYARALTQAAEITVGARGLTPVGAPGASITGAGLHARVSRLLERRPVTRPVAWSATLASVTMLALAVGAVGVMPPLVVVASLEEPVLLLTSAPLGVGVQPGLPDRVAPELTRATGRRLEPSPHLDLSAPSQLPAEQASPEPVAAVGAQAPEPDAGEPLTAEPIPQLVAVQSVAAPATPRWADLGSSASRLGATTGAAAARGGTAIGRFIKDRARWR